MLTSLITLDAVLWSSTAGLAGVSLSRPDIADLRVLAVLVAMLALAMNSWVAALWATARIRSARPAHAAPGDRYWMAYSDLATDLMTPRPDERT